jgi:hypothetical protein
MEKKGHTQRGFNTMRPKILFFLIPTKPLPSYDYASPHRRHTQLV